MISVQFTKMQGLGNDFIVLDGPVSLSADEVRALCDRRRGVGADGVLVVSAGDGVRMEYWNADGSEAEMCGNGLRCVALYAYDRGLAPDRNFMVHTAIGTRGVRVLEDGVEAEIGRPKLGGSRTIGNEEYLLVDMGNPHAVRLVEDPEQIDVESVGQDVQEDFPNGANVEFISLRPDSVEMRVWERGVGETLACGTGIAAAAAIAIERHELASPVEVNVPGGTATVDFRDGVAWLRGPASYSFRGSVGAR